MSTKSKGLRSKTRKVLRVTKKERGKVNINDFFKDFTIGEKVLIKPNPSADLNTIPHRRSFGRSGVIKTKRGSCYEVEFNDKGKKKLLILNPFHLKKNVLKVVKS